MIAGPTVGPDGNIYVISDYGGLGAFALSPAGQLLWSNPGNLTFIERAQLGAEIVFAPGRLFSAFDEYGVAPSTIYGLSLAGVQLWAKPMGGSDDMFMQQQRQPATGSDGSLYLSAMGGANGWSLRRVQPDTGNLLWAYSPWPSNGMSAPSVGPDGSVYLSRSLSFLDSVTPSGQKRWTFSDGGIIDHPAVSPDGAFVLAATGPTSASRDRPARLERRHGHARLAGRPAERERRLPGRLHASALLGRQSDGVLRYRHPGRRRRVLVPVRRAAGGRAAAAATTSATATATACGRIADDHELHADERPGVELRDHQRLELHRRQLGQVQREGRHLVAPPLGGEDRRPGARRRHQRPDLRHERLGHGHERHQLHRQVAAELSVEAGRSSARSRPGVRDVVQAAAQEKPPRWLEFDSLTRG